MNAPPSALGARPNDYTAYPDARGRFGDYGGQYVPETLMPLVHDLDAAYVASLPARTPGVVRIVLSHYPDHVRRIRPLEADLMLAGHTHGGQVCLPGGRPLITHDKLPRPYHHGVHRFEKTWVIVSRGFGFASPPVRLFCPAEVVQITLVGEAR